MRSSAVHARGDARSTNAAALRLFSGRNAQAAAAGYSAIRIRSPSLRSGILPTRAFRWGVPGPYFWPYAYYDDAFWFWPSAYDEVFWNYGYDDVLYSVFRPYAFADYGDFADLIGRPVRRARGHQPAPRSFAEFCGEAAPGLTDWPVDQIAAAVEPTPPQRALLDELIKASDKAAEILRNACPRNVSVTPMGRLDALQQQLAALDQAVRIVRPALEKFYASLSDDQKERFNALAPKGGSDRRRARAVLRRKPTAWRARARMRRPIRIGRSADRGNRAARSTSACRAQRTARRNGRSREDHSIRLPERVAVRPPGVLPQWSSGSTRCCRQLAHCGRRSRNSTQR